MTRSAERVWFLKRMTTIASHAAVGHVCQGCRVYAESVGVHNTVIMSVVFLLLPNYVIHELKTLCLLFAYLGFIDFAALFGLRFSRLQERSTAQL